jgi:hypothetical protein
LVERDCGTGHERLEISPKLTAVNIQRGRRRNHPLRCRAARSHSIRLNSR